jgi:hypothetical protein
MEAAELRTRIGPVQIGIFLLALAAGGVHLYLFLIEGFLGDSSMLPFYQVLFVGNFFGYVSLAAALCLPISMLARFRPAIRVLLISMSVAAIISYFYVDVIDALGNATKVIELLLIVLVMVDAVMARKGRGEGGEGGEEARGGVLGGAVVELVISIVLGIVMVQVIYWIARPILESFL